MLQCAKVLSNIKMLYKYVWLQVFLNNWNTSNKNNRVIQNRLQGKVREDEIFFHSSCRSHRKLSTFLSRLTKRGVLSPNINEISSINEHKNSEFVS